jgi:hypothetical protein
MTGMEMLGKKLFDLRDPASAYVFGFMQADGHHRSLSRNRGYVAIEIKAQDAELLRAMQKVIPWPTSLTFRTRTTNFAASAEQVTLRLFAREARTQLLALGLPIGRKSTIIAPPAEPFSHGDYLRGLYDADGSVGFTATGLPFLSIVTASRVMAEFVRAEILRVTGAVRSARPNKRDGVVNLMIASDPAVTFARWLYQDACIALARKQASGLAVAAWERPASMRARAARKGWTAEEDAIVLGMPQVEAARQLGRTVQSVSMRRWRLHQIVNVKGD